jgi:hypothetical protein
MFSFTSRQARWRATRLSSAGALLVIGRSVFARIVAPRPALHNICQHFL